MKRAIIVGSRGQDGRLLFEFLTQTGYHVVGLDRETTESNCDWDPAAIDILDATEVSAVIERFQPDEVYYLAAFHHSSEESSDGELDFYLRSHDAHVRGLIHFLDAMVRYKPDCRIFYAASSLIFGNPQSEIQDEQTPFNPTSIYGITKLSGLMVCRYYRATHQLFASVGILYNHESKYRGAGFLSKKTVLAAIEIQQGRREKLMLGDLDAVVDWGSAFDYIRAMQRILRHHRGDE
ncbi:MAG: GDP-mannose 4,6-dehydratase, partial [Bdellovibrionota bacterium]